MPNIPPYHLPHMKKLLLLTLLLCTQGFCAELIIYSARKEKFVLPLLKKFEREHNVKVKLLSGVNALKILAEKQKPLGHIFISNDVGQLEFLRTKGALKGTNIKEFFGIPKDHWAKDRSWVGLSARSRIFIYNTEKISPENMPQTLWGLTNHKWKGKFAITRGGNGSMIAHVTALRSLWGEPKTLQWLEGIRKNAGAITKGHTDIRQAVGRGEFPFGLVNNYYYHLQKQEKKNNKVAAFYPDQGKGQIGVFTNSAGMALLNNPNNLTTAEKFIRWAVQERNQKLFIHTSLEVPLNPKLKKTSEVRYKAMKVPLISLGQAWPKTKKLIERAGLDLVLR